MGRRGLVSVFGAWSPDDERQDEHMRKELGDTLYERYPAIFAEYTQPDAEEKGYKIWCGDGWFDLINTLCEQLEYWTVLRNAPQYVVFNVKEKMGALRFVGRHRSAEQMGALQMAYALSTRLCEACGAPGRLVVDGGTIMTRCELHTSEGSILIAENERRKYTIC